MAAGKLHSKLVAVMDSVSRIKKNGYNAFHKYAYVTEADVIEAVKSELVKNKLSLTHSVKSYTQVNDVMTILVDFTLSDAETGETLTTTSIGSGQDKGDKSSYKAITGAYKYYMMKTFLIPTGDDPEASDELGKSTAKPVAAAQTATVAAASSETKKPMVSFSKKAIAKPTTVSTGDDI